jgi:hypothetical protein
MKTTKTGAVLFLAIVGAIVWLVFLKRGAPKGDVELGVPDVTSTDPGVTIGSEGYWSRHDDSQLGVP